MRIRFIKLFEGSETISPYIKEELKRLHHLDTLAKIYKNYLYFISPNKETYDSRGASTRVYEMFQNPELIDQFIDIVENDILDALVGFPERKAAWFTRKIIDYMLTMTYSIVKDPNMESILIKQAKS